MMHQSPPTPTFIAYHNDEAVRSRIIQTLRTGAANGMLIQGQGFYKGFGCKFGILLQEFHRDRFALLFEEEARFPAAASHIAEAIFERLPAGHAQEFAIAFHTNTAVGAVLDNLILRLTVHLLTYLESEAHNAPSALSAIEQTRLLYERQLLGKDVTSTDFAKLAAVISEACRNSLRNDDLETQWFLFRAYEWAAIGANPLTLNPLQPMSNLLDDNFIQIEAVANTLLDLLATSPVWNTRAMSDVRVLEPA